jgi:hypothetical protein
MHKPLQRPRDEAVVDEVVLFDVERWVTAFQVTRPVADDPMAQDQILRACRRTDRIGLNKGHRLESSFQACWFDEVPRDRKPPECIEGN